MKKIALVTGANRGIGKEIARQLGEKGYFILLGSRSKQKGEEALASMTQKSCEGEVLQLDVAKPETFAALKSSIESKWGHLDVLVNNAGILPDGTLSATNVSSDIIQSVFQTNTLGPFLLIQTLLPLLEKSEAGRIINLSSGLGQLDEMNGGYPAYRISKTSLNAVTKMFAFELAEKKIAVNSVCPGWVRTDMGGANATRPVQKGAETAVWLAADASQDLTGQFLRDKQPIPW